MRIEMKNYRLCAFADEAADSLAQQIEALGNIGAHLIEVRAVDGVNIADMTDEQAHSAARQLKDAL